MFPEESDEIETIVEKSDIEKLRDAISDAESTSQLEIILNTGYRPDYTQVSLAQDILEPYDLLLVRSEVLEVLSRYNALPVDVSLSTLKYIAYVYGNRKIVWEDFWEKPDLNIHGISGYKNPAVALATLGYSRYSQIHPYKHYFELLASKGVLPDNVSLSTVLYVAFANGNKEITWDDFWNKTDLNLEGIPTETSPMYLLAKKGDVASVRKLIDNGLQHRPIQFLDDQGQTLRFLTYLPFKITSNELGRYQKRIYKIIFTRTNYSNAEYYPAALEVGAMFLSNPTADLSKNLDLIFAPNLGTKRRRDIDFTAFFTWAAYQNQVSMFESSHFLRMFEQDRAAACEAVIVATAFAQREFLAKAIQQSSIDDATIVEACNVAAITADNETLELLWPRFKALAIKPNVTAHNRVERNLGNPLFTAIYNKHPDTIRFLIAAGITTRSISNVAKQESCLQVAIGILDAEMIMLILSAPDIDLNHQDYYGDTALHTAAKKGNVNIMRQLIDAGANRSLRNTDGKIALDLIEDARARENMSSYRVVAKARPRCNIM